MSKPFKKHIALFFLATLSVFIVPKEFIHALYGHQDTAHHEQNTNQYTSWLEVQHKHCDILQYEAPNYVKSEVAVSFSISSFSFNYHINPHHEPITHSYCLALLRAPPVA